MECGKNYGLQLNWDKIVLLRIRGQDPILDDSEKDMPIKDEAIYLGGLISADGSCSKEINRRIGEAKVAFQNMIMLWNHANLTRKEKLYIFDACICSKLLYELECLCFRRHDFKRINAFYCRCLRRILQIQPSFCSHISNAEV